MSIRTCRVCKVKKPRATGFYPTGTVCRKCRSAQQMTQRRAAGKSTASYQRAWREANSERQVQYSKTWAAKNPDYTRPADTRTEKKCGACDEVLQMTKFSSIKSGPNKGRFSANCKQCASAIAKRWRDENPDRVQVQIRKFAAHPDISSRRKQAYALRKAIKWGNGGKHTAKDLRHLFNRFSGMCAYCETARAEHVDHVVPLARGGSNSIGNLLPACAPCNLGKHTSFIMEWRNRRAA